MDIRLVRIGLGTFVGKNTVSTNTILVPFKAFSIQMIMVNTNYG